jgi:Transglutaminase-like superfamily
MHLPRLKFFMLGVLVPMLLLVSLKSRAEIPSEPKATNRHRDSRCVEIIGHDTTTVESEQAFVKAQALEAQYKNRLGVGADPFLLAYSPEKAQRIEQQMSQRGIEPSVYSLSQALRVHYLLGHHELNTHAVNNIIENTTNELHNNTANRTDLQRNYLALRELQNYLRLFAPQPLVLDRDGEKIEKKTEQEPKKPMEKAPPQKPKYSTPPKDFRAHTKDLKGNPTDDKQEKAIVAHTNSKTPFFVDGYFYDIRRSSGNNFFSTPIVTEIRQPPPPRETGRILTINMLGETQGRMLLPVGTRPLQPFTSDATVVANQYGSYDLMLEKPITNVRIPIVDENPVVVSPPLLTMASARVGYETHEWPDEIQLLIRQLKSSKSTPYEVAKRVEEHFRHKYLYSVGAYDDNDPIEAIHRGSFQCDVAAYLMAAILRDEFGIPVRVAAGYRSEFKNRDASERVLRMPQKEGHLWVEVYDQGRWNIFDPTPEKKDRAENADGEPDDMHPDGLYKPQDKASPKSTEEISAEIAQKSQKTLEDTRDALKNVEDKKTADVFKGLLDDTELRLGSLSLNPKTEENPFRKRVGRLLLRYALEPNQSGEHITENLNKIRRYFKQIQSDDDEIKNLFSNAFEVHRESHPPLVEWIDQISLHMKDRPIGESYNEIYRVLKAIQLYSSLLDEKDAALRPIALQAHLVRVLQILNFFAHPDSSTIATVKKFYDDLSPLLQSVLAEEFNGFTSPGPNEATKNVFLAMQSGRLDALRLVSLLTHHADFILNSTPRPEYREIRTWQRDPNRPTGRDILPIENLSQLPQTILGQPGKSLEENISEGTAFSFVHRLRHLIEDGSGLDSSERITVILYDVSGSMNGTWAKFQAALIAAFVSMAASDVNQQGEPRHRVVIIPFGDNVYEATYVYNREQALELIRKHQVKLGNRGKGTNYKIAILEAFRQFLLAQQQAGNPLASANLLLMGDGQQELTEEDLQEFREARAQIDRDTPVQAMFAAINSTNPILAKLADDSATAGFSSGHYREFDAAIVEEIVAQSVDHSFAQDSSFLYSDRSPRDLPPDVMNSLNLAASEARNYQDLLARASHSFTSMDLQIQAWSRIPWPTRETAERPLHLYIKKLRGDFSDGITAFQSNRRWIERAGSDLCSNFRTITGIDPNQLSQNELEDFRHFINFVAGKEGQ